MFFNQLKVGIVGVLATGVLASGVALAVSSSSGSSRRDAGANTLPAEIAASPARVDAQRTVDQIPDRTIGESSVPRQVAMLDWREPSTAKSINSGPLHELEVELDNATNSYRYTENLFNKKVMSEGEVVQRYNDVRLIEGRLQDILDNLEEDLIRLKLELGKANAETAMGMAKVKIAMTNTVRKEREIAQKIAMTGIARKGTFNDETVAIAEAELDLARAQESSGKAGTEAALALIVLVDKRADAAKAILKKARAVKPPDIKPDTPAK